MYFLITLYHTSTSNRINDPFIDQWRIGDLLVRKYKKDSFKDACLFAVKCRSLELHIAEVNTIVIA